MADQEQFPIKQDLVGVRSDECKYGENPHMQGALYSTGGNDPLALTKFQDEGGDARSLVNYTDVDRLLQTITHIAAGFSRNFGEVPAIAIGVKHGNPCGVGVSLSTDEFPKYGTLVRMLDGNPRAIFGGVVMANFDVRREQAATLCHYGMDTGKRLLDTIAAPSFDDDAREELERKGGKCRLLSNPALGQLAEMGEACLDTTPRRRYVRGGWLEQTNYTYVLDLSAEELEYFGPELSTQQMSDIVLAWAIGSTSNSNTMTLVRDGMLIGNGVGQQDRVGAAELAIKRALDAGHAGLLAGAVAYSDSFFPFPDGVQALVDAGVAAIFTSSGSVNDHMTIEVCEKAEVSLVMVPDSICRGFAWH